MKVDKQFMEMPILLAWSERKLVPAGAPKSIPMAMLDERQAERNHSQTLQRLAERGGLGPDEALAIIDRRRWEYMPMANAWDVLTARVKTYQAACAAADGKGEKG